MASVLTLLSVRRPSCIWISVFLLLIFLQMLISLVLFAGVFIVANEALISPFHFCPTPQYVELSYNGGYRSPVSEIKINILGSVVTLALYIPVVLVAFALLAMLLAAYAKDRAALWFSMACQAASSLLILTGIVGFLVLNQSCVNWEHMTISFYLCVFVQIKLVIITVLTYMSAKSLPSGWE